ncbi:NUDIX domain-containing protein [Candidatus Saccharibacteria bacterium]|nr:NUDIX domain-containing protein [Candidatus Saccharibacteria bacterium]
MTTDEVVYQGSFFEVLNRQQPDGRVFESVRRAPGVRVIISDNESQKVLLTREFRNELNAWNYRLPGGKVFDTLADYQKFLKSGEDVRIVADKKAVEESSEEAGIRVDSLDYIETSTLGSTVEWDLYVYVSSNWIKAEGQSLEEGEQIETDNWFTFAEAEKMILNGEVREERIALILLKWLHRQKEKNDN